MPPEATMPFADVTEDDLYSLSSDKIIVPIYAIPTMGTATMGEDEPEPRVFLKLYGVNVKGEQSENIYLFDAHTVLKIMPMLLTYASNMILDPSAVVEVTESQVEVPKAPPSPYL